MIRIDVLAWMPLPEAYKESEGQGIKRKRAYDAKFFDNKCPYTDKPCYERGCDTCEVEAQEREAMKALDDAEYKEWLESEPQESEEV